MNTDSSRRKLVIRGAAVAVVAAAALFGFARYQSARVHEREVRKIGAEWQSIGLLTEADYVKLRQIQDAALRTHAVSDEKLDWMLATMRKSQEPIVRARVLGILGTLGNSSAAQRDRIASAIVPLLQSRDELDRRYAARVQRLLGLSR